MASLNLAMLASVARGFSVAGSRPAGRYVLNLRSSLKPVKIPSLPHPEALREYRLYVTRFENDGKTWFRLRLGFFATRTDAEQVRRLLDPAFPGVWIATASLAERNAALSEAKRPQPPRPKRLKPSPAKEALSTPRPVSENDLDAAMERARLAMVARDYAQAIRLYTYLLEYPRHRRDALEFLALARERNGQTAHAIAEYERYLRLYPKGDAAARVRQRLAALRTATSKPKKRLNPPKRQKARTRVFERFGSLSQVYRRHQDFSDPDGPRTDLSSLASNLDLTGRLRGDEYDVRAEFAGDLDSDFLARGAGEDFAVTSLYVEATERRLELSTALGRQSRGGDGVFGRFDGGVVSYRVVPKWRINGLAGLPVERSTLDNVQSQRYFYGTSVDVGTFGGHWDANLYFINQMVDGLTDRRATGGELRYFHPKRSFFSLLDYDLSYNELNIFLFTGNLFFANGGTVNAVFDYRKSPGLLTSNALLGRTERSISELKATFSEDDIRQLARDRTASSRFATLGGSYPLNERFQLGGDITVMTLSDTKASAGVPAVEGNGTEIAYNVQLAGSDLLFKRDFMTTSLRYADGRDRDTLSMLINGRYFFGRIWRIDPRLRLDYRTFVDDRRVVAVIPTLRLENRQIENVTIELETGLDWARHLGPMPADDEFGFLVNAGYRWDF